MWRGRPTPPYLTWGRRVGPGSQCRSGTRSSWVMSPDSHPELDNQTGRGTPRRLQGRALLQLPKQQFQPPAPPHPQLRNFPLSPETAAFKEQTDLAGQLPVRQDPRARSSHPALCERPGPQPPTPSASLMVLTSSVGLYYTLYIYMYNFGIFLIIQIIQWLLLFWPGVSLSLSGT